MMDQNTCSERGNRVHRSLPRSAMLLSLSGAFALHASLAEGQTITKYSYDLGDNVTQVIDPRGLVTSYAFDGLGQKWQQTSPDTGSTGFSYDSYGRLGSMTRSDGSTTSYGYDGIGRRTSESAGGQTHTFTYDTCTNGQGRLCGVSDATGSTSYVYSPEGWITARGFQVSGTVYSIGYGYNALGQINAVVYPEGNQALYSYSQGVVSAVQIKVGSTISNVATGITYQPYDLAMAQWTSGNGLVNTLSYDTDGRLTRVAVPGVQSLSMSYDEANRVTGITNGMDAAMSQSFGYDAMSRLTSVYSDADNEALQYDANGNRVNEVIDGGNAVISIDASSNRALGQSGAWNANWGFDPKGNLTTVNGSQVFTYDPFNRLHSSNGATYYVNAEGQRLMKNVGGVTSYFAPDATGPMMAEFTASTGWVDYIWLNGRLVARVPGNTLQFVHADQVGRPEVVTNGAGGVDWHARNFAFDRVVTVANSAPLNLGFPGQYYDAESGLWNNGFRDYSAGLGRYNESDPLGLEAGLNTYTYVDGNPISYVDPPGLTKWQIGIVMTSGGLYGVEGGIGHFMATAKAKSKTGCESLVVAHGVVGFGGPAAGAPFSLTGSQYELDDHIDGNDDPSVLNGLLIYQGGGAAFGAGYSVSNMMMGGAMTSGYSGGSEAGLSGGGASDFGWSHVYSSFKIPL